MQKTTHLGWILAAAAACWLGWMMFVTNLDAESIWYDEWITWNVSRQGPAAMVDSLMTQHPPVYYLWVWSWMQWTQSDDVFVMRLTAVIPAVLAVALCYRVGVAWLHSRWAGLAAAVFLATSGIFVYYARELRMYTLVVLLVLASWWFLVRYLNGHGGSLKNYAALVGLMAYTYFFTAFMVLMHALAVLIFAPRKALRVGMAYGVALLAFLPWLPTFYTQLVLESSRAGRGETLTLSNIGKFAATEPTNWPNIQEFILKYTAEEPAFVILLLTTAIAMGLMYLRRPLTMLVLWLATAALFFTVNLITPVYNLRYPLMIMPALALLVGLAVDRLPARGWMIVVIGSVGIATHTGGFLLPKAPHRELMQTVADQYLPGDRIWYNVEPGRGSTLDLEREYYLQHTVPTLSSEFFVWDAPNDFAPRVWDVRPYWIEMPADVRQALLAERVLVEEYTFGAYFVRLYEAAPDTPEITLGDTLALKVTPLEADEFRAGEPVNLKVWWRALEPIPLDYSYGLYLRNEAGAVVAQVDGGLMLDNRPTSQWPPSEQSALAQLDLTLPANLPPGEYGVWLAVYYWEDPQPIPVNAPEDVPVDAGVVRVAAITVVP